jgi:Protein of unknown function (DUF2591)
MKIKTAVLIGAALDWAVAKCEGASADVLEDFSWRTEDEDVYSTDGSQGVPIIEREGIGTYPVVINGPRGSVWKATMDGSVHHPLRSGAVTAEGPTSLISAMRCYVASRLGNEVEIPEELS